MDERANRGVKHTTEASETRPVLLMVNELSGTIQPKKARRSNAAGYFFIYKSSNIVPDGQYLYTRKNNIQ